jgi:hypothetical protein
MVTDGYYWMSNMSKTNWNYHKTKVPLKKEQGFIIVTVNELEKKLMLMGISDWCGNLMRTGNF